MLRWPRALLVFCIFLCLFAQRLTAQDSTANTYWLSLALVTGDDEEAIALIGQGTPVTLPEAEGPIHFAASYGREEALGAMIARGADLHATTDYGYTPLYLALEQGHESIAFLIVAHGLDPLEERAGEPTAEEYLIAAVYGGASAFVTYLLDRGVSANARSRETGVTALMASAKRGDEGLPIARLLGSRGARAEDTTPQGESAILFAVASNQPCSGLLEYLLTEGARVVCADRYSGAVPLMYAYGNYQEANLAVLAAAAERELLRSRFAPFWTSLKSGRYEELAPYLAERVDVVIVSESFDWIRLDPVAEESFSPREFLELRLWDALMSRPLAYACEIADRDESDCRETDSPTQLVVVYRTTVNEGHMRAVFFRNAASGKIDHVTYVLPNIL